MMGVTAIVLAGGRSSRFGSDKLAAELDGRPLLEHALEAIAAVADEVVLAVPPRSGRALGSELVTSGPIVVEDPEAFEGPLAGLVPALGAATNEVAIVVAGDMPRLQPKVLAALLDALEPGVDAAALEVGVDLRPLPLAIRVEPARAAATAALEAGERSLRSLLARLASRALPEPEWRRLDPAGDSLTDVDRPADLDALRG
jgi:molybdopterin-guanine dinucleotide biosynthesis protein A